MTARGVLTVADLRLRCEVDPVTRCWHWLGAADPRGQPRIWTFDHKRGEKRTMSAAGAVWNIAFGESPNGFAYRGCVTTDCVCPVHIRLARSRAEMWSALARSDKLKGLSLDVKRRNAHVGLKAQGIVLTPISAVLAIRDAPTNVTTMALARQHGIKHQTASAIRRGKTYRWVERASTADDTPKGLGRSDGLLCGGIHAPGESSEKGRGPSPQQFQGASRAARAAHA